MDLPSVAAVDELLAGVLDELDPSLVHERQRAEDLLASALCMYGAALRRARSMAEDHGASELAERWSTHQPLGELLALHGADSPAPPTIATDDVDRASTSVDAILDELEQGPAGPRDRAATMLAAVGELHEVGLAQLMGALDDELRPPPELARVLGRDPVVASLLLVHGLHPEPVDVRVDRELAELGRQSGAAASVELAERGPGGVRLRVRGETPGDAYRLRLHVERVVAERFPDVPVEIDGGQEPTPATTVTIPVESLTVRSSRREAGRGAVS